MSTEEPNGFSFTLRGFVRGFVASWPLGLAIFAYGVVFGIMSKQAGLSLLSALAMGASVFAGASQIVAMGLWGDNLPTLAIIIAVFAVNLRYVFMGAAMYPWLSQISSRKAYICLFFMNDESWALSIERLREGERNIAFFLGSGLLVYLVWLSSTFVGQTFMLAFKDPSVYGLDFAFTAIFLCLLLGVRSGRQDILPWTIAVLVALTSHHFLPGKWYILLGGLAGSGFAAIKNGGKRE